MTADSIVMTWPQYLRRECMFRGQVISLSKREALVLSTLLIRFPNPVHYSDLIESIFEDPDQEPDWSHNTPAMAIMNLRKRFGQSSIITRWGVGYVLNKRIVRQ